MARLLFTFIFGCVLLASSSVAQTKPSAWTSPSAEQVNAIYPEIESLYIDLHRSPELALHEQQTAAKLAERMKALGYEVTSGVGGTGVVAILETALAARFCCAPTWTRCRLKKRPACRLPARWS